MENSLALRARSYKKVHNKDTEINKILYFYCVPFQLLFFHRSPPAVYYLTSTHEVNLKASVWGNSHGAWFGITSENRRTRIGIWMALPVEVAGRIS